MTGVYLSLLINIPCQEGRGGEEQHIFLCFEAFEKERHLCYLKHLQDTIATCSEEALEQVGEFLGRSHWGVTLTGSTPKDIQVDGELHGSQGESMERDQPCPGALWGAAGKVLESFHPGNGPLGTHP